MSLLTLLNNSTHIPPVMKAGSDGGSISVAETSNKVSLTKVAKVTQTFDTTVEGWTSVVGGSIAVDNAVFNTGTGSLKWTRVDTNIAEVLGSAIDLASNGIAIGDTIVIDFAAGSGGFDDDLSWGLIFLNSSGGTVQQTPTNYVNLAAGGGGWKQITGNFTVPANSVSVKVNIIRDGFPSANNSITHIDRVVLSAFVPEVQTTQSPFSWKGRSWNIRTGNLLSPGPTNFTAEHGNVKIDTNGDLLLGIYNSPTVGWSGAEVQFAGGSLGYGKYQWVVDHTNVAGWDIKPVLGLFTYDDAEPTATHFREIDIEVSKWNAATERSEVWYTVQPPIPGTNWDHPITTENGPYTYEFYWEPAKVYWRTLDASGNVIGESKAVESLFAPGTENVRMNLWLVNGNAPTNGLAHQVRIKDFIHTPNATFTEPSTKSYDFSNDRGFQLKGTGADVSVANSAISITPTLNDYSLAKSGRLFSLEQDGFTIDAEITATSAVGNGTIENVAWLGWHDPDNYSGFFIAGGSLYWRNRVAAVNTGALIGTFDPVAHRWIRVEKSGTNILFRTSPDNVTWTTRATQAQGYSNLFASALHAYFEAGHYAAETSPTPFRIATLQSTNNVVASTPKAGTDSGSIAISETTSLMRSIAASDSAAVSVSETNARFVTKEATDSVAITVTEANTSFRTLTPNSTKLVNYDFEDGSIAYPKSIAALTLTNEVGPAHSGTRSIKALGSVANPDQWFNVSASTTAPKPFTRYRLSARVWVPSGLVTATDVHNNAKDQGPMWLRLGDGSIAIAQGINYNLRDQWQYQAVETLTGANPVSWELRFYSASNTGLFWDSISLDEVTYADNAAIRVAESATVNVFVSASDTAAITASDTGTPLVFSNEFKTASDTLALDMSYSRSVSIGYQPQVLRPDGAGTVSGTWTGTWADVNEVVPDDLTFIASSTNPAVSDFYSMTLQDPVTPIEPTGDHILRFRYSKDANAGRNIALAIQVRQGDGTIIAELDVGIIPDATWRQAEYTLTPAEVANITDYSDIRVRFNPTASGGGAGRAAELSWLEFQVPAQIATDPIFGSETTDLAVTETANVVVTLDAKSASDTSSIAVSETTSSLRGITASDSSAITASDTSAVSKMFSSTDDLSIGITEATNIVGAITFVNASDGGSLSVTETTASLRTIPVSDSAIMTVTDVASVGSTLPGTESISIGVGEAAVVNVSLSVADSGALTTTESQTTFQTRSASDSASIATTESVSQFKTMNSSDTSSIAGTEVVNVSTNAFTPGADTMAIGVVETASVLVIVNVSDTAVLSLSENFTVLSSLTSSDGLSFVASETASNFVLSGSGDTVTENFNGTFPANIRTSNGLGVGHGSVFLDNGTLRSDGSGDWWYFNDPAWTVNGNFDISYDIFWPSNTSGRDIANFAFWMNDVSNNVANSTADGFMFRIDHAGGGGYFDVINGVHSVHLAGQTVTGELATDAGTRVAYPGAGVAHRYNMKAVGSVITTTVTRISDGVLRATATVDLGVSAVKSGTFGQKQDGAASAEGHRWDNFALTTGNAINDSVSLSVAETSDILVYAVKSASETSSLTVSDNTTTFSSGSVNDTASLSVSEATSFTKFIASTDSAALTLTDESAQSVTLSGSDTFALSTSETNASLRAIVANDTGSVAVTETTAVLTDANLPANETISLGLVEESSMTVFVSTTDTNQLSVTESASNYVTASASDSASLTANDVSVIASFNFVTSSDGLSMVVTDASTSFISLDTTDNTVISLNETPDIYSNLSRSDSAALTVSESAASFLGIFANESATITVNETSVMTKAIASSDTASLAVSESNTLFKAIQVVDEVAVGIIEVGSLGGGSMVPGMESAALAVAEQVSISSAGTTNDTAALSVVETRAINSALTRTDNASLTATETASLLVNRLVSATDACAIAASETQTSFVSQSRTDSSTLSTAESTSSARGFEVSDSAVVAVTESAANYVTVYATDSNALSVADNSTVFKAISASDTGGLSATENTATFKAVAANDSASLTLSEAVAYSTMLPGQDNVALSVSEQAATFVSLMVSDNTALAVNEIRATEVTVNAVDSIALSASENASQFISKSGTDVLTFNVTEVSADEVLSGGVASDSLVVTLTESVHNLVVLSSSDSMSVSIAENTTRFVTRVAFDAAQFGLGDISSVAKSSTREDESAIGVIENAAIVAFVSVSATDNSSLTAAEVANESIRIYSHDNTFIGITDGVSVLGGSQPGSDSLGLNMSEQNEIFVTTQADEEINLYMFENMVLRVPISSIDSGSVGVVESSDAVGREANEVHPFIYLNGEWERGTIMVYRNNRWTETSAYAYNNGTWRSNEG